MLQYIHVYTAVPLLYYYHIFSTLSCAMLGREIQLYGYEII